MVKFLNGRIDLPNGLNAFGSEIPDGFISCLGRPAFGSEIPDGLSPALVDPLLDLRSQLSPALVDPLLDLRSQTDYLLPW